ncbi:MAG: hypothetical protein LLG20_25840 [Acidobacteriales bacterium]|nr:hypothetical protein [Terriglobales bacterium]
MKKNITTTLGAALGMAVLLTLFATTSAFGADYVIKANIPFAFKAKSETLPAGEYQFSVDRQTELVNIIGPKHWAGAIPIITLLAGAPHNGGKDCHLVFDRVGDTYTLSEIWQLGGDGVLVYATKGEHKHHVLHVKS